jgi:hypothetical protein
MSTKSAPNPFRQPWRVMVLIICGPVAAAGVAFAAWFGGNSMAFSTYAPADDSGRPLVIMPERVKGADLAEYQCRQFADAGDTASTWYTTHCR